MQKTENIKLTIFVDSWCPLCKRFAKNISKYDKQNYIAIEDIRTSSNPLINHEKALKALASIDSKGRVFYGFDTIHQLCVTFPILYLFLPITFLLKISRLGAFLYNELAVRRAIIPLRCDKENCICIESKS